MAIYKTNMMDIDLAKGQIYRSFLNHSIGTQDQQADRFGIRVFRDWEEVDLTGVTVQGVFMPPQGAPIAITGSTYTSIDGNTAEVILPQACYNYEGKFTLAIKLVDATNAVTGTMRIVDGMVDNTHASGTVAPTGSVPTYQEVLAVYDDMVDALVTVDELDNEVSGLKSVLDVVIGAESFTWKDGKTIHSDGTEGTASNYSYTENFIPVCPNTKIIICTKINGTAGIVVYRSDKSTVDAGYTKTSESGGVLYQYVITLSDKAAYVRFSCGTADKNDAYIVKEKENKLIFDDLPTEDSTNPVTSTGIFRIQEAFEILDEVSLITGFQIGKGYNTTGSTIDISSPSTSSNMMCTYAECSPGDKFTYSGYGSSSYRSYAFINSNDSNAIVGDLPEAGLYTNLVITAPANATHVVFNSRKYGSTYKTAIWKGAFAKNENISFSGCKLSLLGDSISAIEGYSTNGHKYYPNSGSDVQNVSEMWWKQVADYFGMIPLVIGGWSGSTVASGIRSASSYTPASDPSRCENLHDGTTNPDVVLIAMGVNDYSYDDSESEFGTWDGTTALGTESDLSDYETGDFKRAYATMLARIQHKYPNAFIICITPWFVERYDTDTGANFLNDIGKSISDYAEAVREICKIMHVTCINGTDIGFNRYNYYPTYCIDSATKPTHPNAAGQAQMAKAIIEQMKNIHRLGS